MPYRPQYKNSQGAMVDLPLDAETLKGVAVVDSNGQIVLPISYTTTAPTSANTTGIKICVLSSEPSTKYSGWLYLITG